MRRWVVLLICLDVADLATIGTFTKGAASAFGNPAGWRAWRTRLSHRFISTISGQNALLLLASLPAFFVPFKARQLLL